MKRALKTFLVTVTVLLALTACGVIYRTSYAKTEIVTETSTDGQYTLKIYMIGEPDWPFGETHCRFDLMKGSESIVRYPFSICDDGSVAHESNFVVLWSESDVTVTVSGSEQSDDVYVLGFDGEVYKQ